MNIESRFQYKGITIGYRDGTKTNFFVSNKCFNERRMNHEYTFWKILKVCVTNVRIALKWMRHWPWKRLEICVLMQFLSWRDTTVIRVINNKDLSNSNWLDYKISCTEYLLKYICQLDVFFDFSYSLNKNVHNLEKHEIKIAKMNHKCEKSCVLWCSECTDWRKKVIKTEDTNAFLYKHTSHYQNLC